MNDRMRKILESKANKRKQLAALPFADQMKLLEQLRDRALAIAASPLKAGKYPAPLAGALALHDKPLNFRKQ